jgi:hypothetical protein
MAPRLPPPDPCEPSPPDGFPVSAPSAVFMHGRPAPAAQGLAEAILAFRPGLLFVYLG